MYNINKKHIIYNIYTKNTKTQTYTLTNTQFTPLESTCTSFQLHMDLTYQTDILDE